MLCPSCHRQLSKDDPACRSCGTPLDHSAAPLELVLPDATRLPLLGEITIGRGAGSTVQLADPSVSRRHARIVCNGSSRPTIEDTGSSYGTYVDGVRVVAPHPLRDGEQIAVGDQEFSIRRHRDDAQAGRTIVVPPGASLLVGSAAGHELTSTALSGGAHPRVRSGYALKRLDASEGRHRWVLRDLNGEGFLRLSDNDAQLFELLDGRRSLSDLVGESEQRFAARGPARLARLLADLGDRGLLAGVAGAEPGAAAGAAPQSRMRRLLTPREWSSERLTGSFERIYERGGWLLFTRMALVALGALAVVGLGTFGYLIAARYGTPFVVAHKVGLGALVFLLGRFALVALHEGAHGLALASYGRRPTKAGIKLIVVIPFAFTDVSEAWFEPRGRRIVISLAGPVSDVVLGGLFSICCLLAGGNTREIFFQLAFAAYFGGLFNLNPFLERDGYHALVDVLREPGLRRRAKAQLSRRLSQGRSEHDSHVLARYSLAGLVWLVVAAGFAFVMSLRYHTILAELAPPAVVWGVYGALWAAFLTPVLIAVVPPLVQRWRPARVAPGAAT